MSGGNKAEIGIALFDGQLKLLSWNEAFFDIQMLPGGLAELSRPLNDFVRCFATQQKLGLGETERRTRHVIDEVRSAQPHHEIWTTVDGVEVCRIFAPLYSGGVICACWVIGGVALPADAFAQGAAVSSRTDVLDALDCIPAGFAMFDRQDCLVFCNEGYRGFHDRMRDSLLPGTKYEAILHASFDSGQIADPDITAEDLVTVHRRVLDGASQTYEVRLGDGRWMRCSETRTVDGNTVSIRSDITEPKHRENELERLSHALKMQNLHFDTALNNMVQGLCLFDAEQKLIVCNQRYLEMYGFSPEVVRPGIRLRDIMEYSISLGNYKSDEAGRALAQRPEQAAGREQSVLEQWLRDGRVISVLHQPMTGGGSVATYEDITERKQAEKRLELHARELERRNQELQDFAYVASHDLQEPLRKIEAFGSRLRDRYMDKLEGDGKVYVERMEHAARRMRDLIQDLLSYSRVSTEDKPMEACHLSEIANEVLSDLEIAIGEKGAEVRVGELPTLKASPIQMRQLFQNLLSNALKFVRSDVTPLIEISAKEVTEVDSEDTNDLRSLVEFSVKDNGIGFDQKYASQIFGIFQRLHGRGAFEGTGIGLATCRKILERHKGKIAAYGVPNEGATIKFWLPKEQA